VIFPSINALFIHIPKCAGMSVINILNNAKIYPTKLQWHRKLDFYSEEINSMYKFTFIRNPWDRIASHFYFQGPGAPEWPEKDINQMVTTKRQYRYPSGFHKMSFKEFVLKFVCNENVIPSNKNLFISQPITHRLKNKQDEIDFDFIGRVENFGEDFANLTKQLNITTNSLKVNNNNQNTNYRNLYDSYLYDVVKEYFKEEIDYFGFEYNIK
jgi:hypothetical protein